MEVSGRRTDLDTNTCIDLSTEIHTCDSCNDDGLIVDAVSYCRDCSEYLCHDCAKHHCRPKPCKDHVIVTLVKEQNSTDASSAPPLPPRRYKHGYAYCDKHPIELIKYICEIHNRRMCHACVTLDHKNCDNVQYLPDVISKKKKDIDFHLKYVEEKRTTKISNLQKGLENSKTSYSHAKRAIEDHRKIVMKYFEEVETALETKIKNIEENVDKKVKEMSNLESSVQELESKFKESDNLDRLNATYADVESLSNKIGAIHSKDQYTIMSYDQATNKCELGEIHQKIAEPLSTFSLKKKIDSAPPGVRGGSLKGGLLLPNGRLVFADWRNKTLVLVDVKNDKALSIFECAEKPMEVERIEGMDIAVLFPVVGFIQFFSVTDVFTCVPGCDLELKESFLGMKFDYTSRQLVLLTKDSIQFVDLKGALLKKITLKAESIWPNHLAIVPGKLLFFSDVYRHCVTCMDYDGNVVKEYKYLDGDLKGPYGLFVDSSNILYICGVKILLCITPDEKWQTLISPDEDRYPQTVVVCEKRGLMFVGQAQKSAADILVFSIERQSPALLLD